jgi:hypothetical protein
LIVFAVKYSWYSVYLRKIQFKIIAMEKSAKEEQTPGRPLVSYRHVLPCRPALPDFPSSVPPGKCDHRLPHEIAAAILTAAYEVVVKKLAWERETGG